MGGERMLIEGGENDAEQETVTVAVTEGKAQHTAQQRCSHKCREENDQLNM